jgi:hypothetical protein
VSPAAQEPSEAPAADDSAGVAVVRDVTLSFERANVIAVAFVPIALLCVAAHWAAWGGASVGAGFRTVIHPLFFFPVLIASIVVHEALHALGFRLVGRAPRGAVRFGFHRKTLSPFAGCRAPLGAGAYRASVLLPAAVLGFAPVAAGLAAGAAWLTLWGAFMVLTAGGDFAVLWAMRSVRPDERVLDHPERVGCRVVR